MREKRGNPLHYQRGRESEGRREREEGERSNVVVWWWWWWWIEWEGAL